MDYKKVILSFFLFWSFGNIVSQPIYPGTLTVVFTIDNDTLEFENLLKQSENSLWTYGYCNNDTFNISIDKFISNWNFIDGNFILLNTGSSLLSKYDIKKISIIKNIKDTMEIHILSAENTVNYFLHIPFFVGSYCLNVDTILNERKYDDLTITQHSLNYSKYKIKVVSTNKSALIITPLSWRKNLCHDK